MHTNLDSYTSGLGELQEVVAELLHPTGEDLDISYSLQAFHQGSGPVVHTHPGYNLHDKYTACTKHYDHVINIRPPIYFTINMSMLFQGLNFLTISLFKRCLFDLC